MSLRRRRSSSCLNCRRPYARTESAADFPVPQVAEALVEVSKVFPKDRIQQRFAEQTIDTPGISLAEKIVEGPVIQTQGKTQRVVNTSVQYVIDTLEVEKHIFQEKINQVTRHVETTLLQFINKAVNTHVVAQRQIRMNGKVHKTIEILQLQHTDQVVDVPAVLVAQVPHMRVVMKTVETHTVAVGRAGPTGVDRGGGSRVTVGRASSTGARRDGNS